MQLQESTALRTPREFPRRAAWERLIPGLFYLCMQLASSQARRYQSVPRASWVLELQVLLQPVSERNQQLLPPVHPPPECSPASSLPCPHCLCFPTCFCGQVKKEVWSIHPLHWGLAWGFDGDGFSLMVLEAQFLVCFPLILSLSSKATLQTECSGESTQKEVNKEIVTFHQLNKSTKLRVSSL